jgi:hypothetical protein
LVIFRRCCDLDDDVDVFGRSGVARGCIGNQQSRRGAA